MVQNIQDSCKLAMMPVMVQKVTVASTSCLNVKVSSQAEALRAEEAAEALRAWKCRGSHHMQALTGSYDTAQRLCRLKGFRQSIIELHEQPGRPGGLYTLTEGRRPGR